MRPELANSSGESVAARARYRASAGNFAALIVSPSSLALAASLRPQRFAPPANAAVCRRRAVARYRAAFLAFWSSSAILTLTTGAGSAEHDGFAAGLLDFFQGAGAEAVGGDLELLGQLAIAQDLEHVVAALGQVLGLEDFGRDFVAGVEQRLPGRRR